MDWVRVEPVRPIFAISRTLIKIPKIITRTPNSLTQNRSEESTTEQRPIPHHSQIAFHDSDLNDPGAGGDCDGVLSPEVASHALDQVSSRFWRIVFFHSEKNLRARDETLRFLDNITLMTEGMLAILAFGGALSAWRSKRPVSVFCAFTALAMAIGALTYGAFLLILSRRPEGALLSRVPGQLPGMGAMFALVLGLPCGLVVASISSCVRWALNRVEFPGLRNPLK